MWKAKHSLVTCIIYILTHQVLHIHAWTWQCINEQCVRNENPSVENINGSLEICRLTCGTYGAIWPQPTGYTAISNKVVCFDPRGVYFNFSAVTGFYESPVTQFMTEASHLFVENLSRMCNNNCTAVTKTTVSVSIGTTSSDLNLNWSTDESYTVKVTTRGNEGVWWAGTYQVTVEIQANTVYGARHALETLSQLVTRTPSNKLVIITTAKVSDKPVYPHRGLLLDTARHYLPISAIKRNIDAMASCKLNVLHWHATDTQSFPLKLPTVPQMARFGAYSDSEVYTSSDIQMLINYARVRGVRILLELDMPAHAGNGWQWGPSADLGTLAVCVNQQPWRRFCVQPPCGQLNPANPNMYGVMGNIFKDIIDCLPQGEAIHMGGDEVFIPCWNHSTEVTDWMKSRGMGLSPADFLHVWGEFHQKALQVYDKEVGNNNTQAVIWTSGLTQADVISQFLDKDRFVIEAWIDSNDPLAERLLDMGYRIIMATKDAWYLDHGFWGRTQYYRWRQVYDNRLPQGQGVLGGEVAMWGELVDDSNIDSRVWPRATALAERLWTDPKSSSSEAEYRLIEQRERLVIRGVQPEAVTPQWCAYNEGECVGSSNTM